MAKQVPIDEAVFEALTNVYGTQEEAVTRAVSGYLAIREITLRSLTNFFFGRN